MAYRLAPGNVLQLMYLEKRLKGTHYRTFIEVGSGNGHVSRCLLKMGLTGIGFDLNSSANGNNLHENRDFVHAGKYKVFSEDFLTSVHVEKADVIISSMVIEHLPADQLNAYFNRCKELLVSGGVLITFVPGSPRHWGPEDEIAGHVKRYSFSDLEEISEHHQFKLLHLAGLTYPLSNVLLPVSNFLVNRAENSKLDLSSHERTVASGNRSVPLKTLMPDFFKYLINRWTLFPFFILQSIFKRNTSSLVLYSEMGK